MATSKSDKSAGTQGGIFPESPFRGVEPFRFSDRPIFFGREEEIENLSNLVLFYRGVLFYGESGAGKSSLISCGVIPFAMEKGYQPERVLIRPDEGKEIIINRIENGEGGYLPSVFIDKNFKEAQKIISLKEFIEILSKDAYSIDESSGSKIKREIFPFLIFDQFEEVITFFEESPGTKEEREKKLLLQKDIFEAIRYLVYNDSLGIKLLFSFREDYLPKFSKFFEEVPDLPDQSLRLLLMKTNLAETIISGPFHSPALKNHFGKAFSDKLIKNIVLDIESLDAQALNLTELQIACKILWEADDAEKLFHAKGIRGLYEDFFAEAMNKVSPACHDVALEILGRLVIKDTRDTVSGERLTEELEAIENEKGEKKYTVQNINTALKELENKARLIRKDLITARTYSYTIISEYLVQWINNIKSQRIETEKQLQTAARLQSEQVLRRSIEEQLRNEEKTRKGAEEQIKLLEKKRLRRRQIYLTIIAGIFFISALLSTYLAKEANDNKETATANLALANKNAEKATFEKTLAEKQKLIADSARIIAEKAKEYADAQKDRALDLLLQNKRISGKLARQVSELRQQHEEIIAEQSENFGLQLAAGMTNYDKLMQSDNYKLLVSGFDYYYSKGEYPKSEAVFSKLLNFPADQDFKNDIHSITLKSCEIIEKQYLALPDTGRAALNLIRKEISYLNSLDIYEKTNDTRQKLAGLFSSLAWRILLCCPQSKYKNALDTALLALGTDPDQDRLYAKAAIAYAMNGKTKDAKKIYKKFRNKSFNDDPQNTAYSRFNNDLADLKKYNIVVPEEKEIYKFLN